MKRTIWCGWCAAGCLAGLLSGGLALSQEAAPKRVRVAVEPGAASQPRATMVTEDAVPPPQAERRVILLTDGPRSGAVEIVAEEAAGQAKPTRVVKPSPFWIGVQLDPEPLPELLQKHLQLTGGVVVTEVFDDSPAAKVGVKAGDILLRAGNAKLAGPPDLVDAVTAAGEKPLKLALLREGKELEIELTPVKRQETENPADPADASGPADVEALLRALQANPALRRDLILPRVEAFWLGGTEQAKLPANVKVKLTKAGEQPAQVQVERDGKTWEVDEKSLDKLPADLRGPVQSLLGGGLGTAAWAPGFQFNTQKGLRPTVAGAALPSTAQPLPPGTQFRPTPFAIPAPPHFSGNVDAKLDAILKRLDAMTTESQQQMEREVKRLRADVEALQKRAESADKK